MSILSLCLLFICAFIGGVAVFFVKNSHNNKNLKLVLSFSGAYLFAITILHLLPDVYAGDETHLVGLFILGGFILQILMEQFSQGIEHGHIHVHQHEQSFPWAIMLSLSLHAFLEGMPLGSKNNQLVYGIAIHHIPASFALGSVLLANHVPNKKVIALIILFSAMSPLGYFFSYSLSHGDISSLSSFFPYIMGIVIGIFLHISTTILFEASVDHRFTIRKTIAVMLGICIALFGFFLEG